MFSLLFALFLAVSEENPVCQSRFDSDEDLYKSITLSPEDNFLKQKYLAKFGTCFSAEGQNLIVEKDLAIVEELNCTTPLEGIEFFFRNKKLCSRSVRFFPSEKVFTVENRHIPVVLPENWKYIETQETLLFYDSTAKFEENSGISGEILKKNWFGLYLNAAGKAVYPEFVYDGGKWGRVMPLREFFGLFPKDDGGFEIVVISEKHSRFNQKELFALLELRAGSAELSAVDSASLKIAGKGLKGVKFPKFEYSPDNESDFGTYEIVFKDEKRQNREINLNSAEYEMKISVSDGFFRAKLTISAKKLSDGEAAKIQSVINREIPSFFVSP